jgi:hypothetical protein
MPCQPGADQIPSYLKAVTILEPVGNVTAEACAVVDGMGRLSLPGEEIVPERVNRSPLGYGDLVVYRRRSRMAYSLDPKSARVSNAQYARRNKPCDESSGDCRSRDRGRFVECRIIIREHCHESEID